MANGKSITIDIPKFEGDPEILPFFIDQIKNLAAINKFSEQAKIALLKSKLTGPALKFVIQKPNLFQSNDFEEIEKELADFFAPPSKTQALVEFNSLILLPAESIKNFAHRLNVLVSRVYPEILDRVAINNIKFLKFISAIPSNLRMKLQEEGISDYHQAVTRAQNLQEITNNEKLLNAHATPVSESIFEETLKNLNEKINALQLTSQNNTQTNTNNRSPRNDFENSSYNKKKPFGFRQHKKFSHVDRFKRSSPRDNFKHRTYICQLCKRHGHEADFCFRWKRANTQRKNYTNSKSSDYYRYNNQGYRQNNSEN